MRKIAIFISCLLLAAGCKNFNPVKDSSVRTVKFAVDPRNAFDSVMVEMEDTVMMVSPTILPDGYSLRTEVFCYSTRGTFERKTTYLQDSIVPFTVSLTHIDTMQQHKFLFVTDIVRKLGNDMYQYTWPTFDPNDLSTIYTMYVSSFEKTTPWLNLLAYSEWTGYPKTNAEPIELESISRFAKFEIANGTSLDEIKIDLLQPTSLMFFPIRTRKNGLNTIKKVLPSSDEYQFPFTFVGTNGEVSVRVITKKVNDIDTTSKKITLGNHPFTLTYDCETNKFKIRDL